MQKKKQSLDLNLEVPGGGSFHVRVADGVRLSKIKRFISKGTGVPPTSICLYHEHLALTGDYPLSHYNLRGDDKGIVSVRIEQGLLGGGGGCCCCFIPCPPPCLKKKEEGDEDSARDNYYPTT